MPRIDIGNLAKGKQIHREQENEKWNRSSCIVDFSSTMEMKCLLRVTSVDYINTRNDLCVHSTC